MIKPARGKVAKCSMGRLGLICSDEPQEITYPDGETGKAWTGVHLEPGWEGKPWSSRKPLVLGSMISMLAAPIGLPESGREA